jgi:acyl carrier protein
LVVGLEIVELIMAVETEFDIEIPNDIASGLVSVGKLYDCVLQTLQARGEIVDNEAIWSRLRDVIVHELGVRPEKIVPDAEFVRDLNAD